MMRTISFLPRFLVVALSLSVGGAFASPKYQAYYVASGSMEKTLLLNDRILVDKNAYEKRVPKRGEVVIFKPPKAAFHWSKASPDDVVFVMRVVALPGETVEVRSGKVFINGASIKEPYANWDVSSRYDAKVVNGKVYTRDVSPEGRKSMWTHNSLVMPTTEQAKIDKAKPWRVPANHFFILGDNRGNSNDSHVWGFLQRSAISGQAIDVFWPLSHRKPLR